MLTPMCNHSTVTRMYIICDIFVKSLIAFNMFEDVFFLLLADHILITLLPDLCQRTFS